MLVTAGPRTANELSLAITAEHSQFGIAILSNRDTMLALLSWVYACSPRCFIDLSEYTAVLPTVSPAS